MHACSIKIHTRSIAPQWSYTCMFYQDTYTLIASQGRICMFYPDTYTLNRLVGVAYLYVLSRHIHAHRLAGVVHIYVLSRHIHAQSPRRGRIHVCSIKTHSCLSPRRGRTHICSIQTHTRPLGVKSCARSTGVGYAPNMRAP